MIREAGAVAGLAGLLGVATLWSLAWSQARDVRRLREWAAGASERSAAAAGAGPSRARPRRGGPRSVAVAVVVGVLLLGGAAAALTRGGDEDDHAGTARTKAHRKVSKKPGRAAPAVEPVVPADVTVAVLNGTTVPGLAAALRDRVVAVGYGKGIINVFSDQQLAASVVQYAPGREAAAQAVGRALGIERREPVTAGSRMLAGDAAVVVIAGADQAP